MTLTTLPAYAPFLTQVAQYIHEKVQQDPLRAADIYVILPTERACLGLEHAFQGLNRSLVLPQIRALTSWVQAPNDKRTLITPLQRHLLLSHLLQEKTRSSWNECFSLAASLMTLLDTFYTEEVALDALESLVPAELSSHWQHSLDLLRIVIHQWPDHLENLGLQEPLIARSQAFEHQQKRWQDHPPRGPVIAAGVVGTVPNAGRFLKAIAALSQGEVILSDLDQSLEEIAWNTLPVYHPQYGLKQTLDRMEKNRTHVQTWPLPLTPTPAEQARAHLLQQLFAQEGLHGSQIASWLETGALDTWELVEVASVQEEARRIALIIRHALTTPENYIALVTPSRNLSDRVTAELKRWHITPNDSYGESLLHRPQGSLLHLSLALALNFQDKVTLLALLKHPLTRLGLESVVCRRQARRLEMTYFRTAFPAAVFESSQIKEDDLREFYTCFEEAARPLRGGPALLSVWVKRHRQWLDALTKAVDNLEDNQDDDEDDRRTALSFGQGSEGKSILEVMDHLTELSSSQLFSLAEYAGLLTRTLKTLRVSQNYGLHPRVHILGPLEARLINYDVLILGGMNDMHWSEPPLPDPWLNMEMRQQLGLPDERYHGGLMAAHWIKFMQSKRTVLTRSQREKGTAVLPSRWLLRLKAILESHQQAHQLSSMHPWQCWSQSLDKKDQRQDSLQGGIEQVIERKPLVQPQPCPPIALRPRQLSITDVQLWVQDPYALYVKKILQLMPLSPLNPEITAALFGIVVHRVLETFVQKPARCQTWEELETLGRQAFALHFTHPVVRVLWWPRFVRLSLWFIEEQRYRLPMIQALYSEVKGSLTFQTGLGSFTLIGTADRIDVLQDGTLEIIDYKTGTLPARKAVVDGDAVQLPLEAAIARYGVWQGLSATLKTVKAVSFWQLKGGLPAGTLLRFDEAEKLADQVLENLKQQVRQFENLAQPYVANADATNIYDPLARRQEWRTRTQIL